MLRGLGYRIEQVASEVAGFKHFHRLQNDKVEALEAKIVDLTKALERHVGTSLEIMLAEENLFRLQLEQNKILLEQQVGVNNPPIEGMKVYGKPEEE